jgi:hypothetical protein
LRLTVPGFKCARAAGTIPRDKFSLRNLGALGGSAVSRVAKRIHRRAAKNAEVPQRKL